MKVVEKQDLKKTLYSAFPEKFCEDFFFEEIIEGLSSEVLIIWNFSSNNSNIYHSFAFELDCFLECEEVSHPNKCWITSEEVTGINPHPDYKPFTYKNTIFHPYSINLGKYGNIDAKKLKSICQNLYDNIKK